MKLGNLVFVTRTNEEAVLARVDDTTRVQCEGCTRGDAASEVWPGVFMHSAPKFDNGVEGQPFRCLKAPKHPLDAPPLMNAHDHAEFQKQCE